MGDFFYFLNIYLLFDLSIKDYYNNISFYYSWQGCDLQFDYVNMVLSNHLNDGTISEKITAWRHTDANLNYVITTSNGYYIQLKEINKNHSNLAGGSSKERLFPADSISSLHLKKEYFNLIILDDFGIVFWSEDIPPSFTCLEDLPEDLQSDIKKIIN